MLQKASHEIFKVTLTLLMGVLILGCNTISKEQREENKRQTERDRIQKEDRIAKDKAFREAAARPKSDDGQLKSYVKSLTIKVPAQTGSFFNLYSGKGTKGTVSKLRQPYPTRTEMENKIGKAVEIDKGTNKEMADVEWRGNTVSLYAKFDPDGRLLFLNVSEFHIDAKPDTSSYISEHIGRKVSDWNSYKSR